MSDEPPKPATADDDVMIEPKVNPYVNNDCQVYVPPGKTLDMRTWDCLDVELWMSCFIPNDVRDEAFFACQKFRLDGVTLNGLLDTRRNDDQMFFFGFRNAMFERIRQHGKAVDAEYKIQQDKKYPIEVLQVIKHEPQACKQEPE